MTWEIRSPGHKVTRSDPGRAPKCHDQLTLVANGFQTKPHSLAFTLSRSQKKERTVLHLYTTTTKKKQSIHYTQQDKAVTMTKIKAWWNQPLGKITYLWTLMSAVQNSSRNRGLSSPKTTSQTQSSLSRRHHVALTQRSHVSQPMRRAAVSSSSRFPSTRVQTSSLPDFPALGAAPDQPSLPSKDTEFVAGKDPKPCHTVP